MRPLGLALVILAVLMPLVWSVGLFAKHDPIAVFSQYLGMCALILMGIVQFLATRAPGLSLVFGPLDKAYVLHKWLAVSALSAAALHDMIDAEIDGLGRETATVVLAETAGETAFYGLLLLGFATIIPFIPYHLWRISHRFIGAFFALAAFHYLFILKPFSNGDPLGLYVGAFCLIGVGSYLYMLLLYRHVAGRKRYVVDKITDLGAVQEMHLTAVGAGLRHKAGQFAFVNFDLDGMDEVHPFTLSSPPHDDRRLRVAIKSAGDFTSKLKGAIKPGVQVVLRGPYGGFTRAKGPAPQIWVAGGIGVTPFLAWMRGIKGELPAKTWFFYCASEPNPPFAEELSRLADDIPNLDFIPVNTRRDGRLTGDDIRREIGGAIAEAQGWYCGPTGLREALEADLPEINFHHEAFEIRSGIGVRKAAAWLVARAQQWVQARAARREEAQNATE